MRANQRKVAEFWVKSREKCDFTVLESGRYQYLNFHKQITGHN